MYHVLHYVQHMRVERVLFALLSCAFVCAFGVYIYAIVASVSNVVLRQELMVSIDHMRARISELEGTYFAKEQALTEDTATSEGFVSVAPHAYISVSRPERLSQATY